MVFGVITFLEACFVIYCLVYLIGIAVSDCDLQLVAFKLFGKKIGQLKGKIVWITGASSGIGESLAKILAENGARVVISARRSDQLERVRSEILKNPEVNPDNVYVLQMDMTKIYKHREYFNQVLTHFGALDILVNNAGRSQRANWEDIENEVDKQLFDLNVFAPVALSRIVTKYFESRGGGHLVVTSSIAGLLPAPFSGSYTGSKHAIHGYFNSLRMEKLNTKLKVTLLCPGPVHTDFLSQSFTSRNGEVYGQSVATTDRRMTAARCAELSAIAIVNELPEAWISINPVLFLTYTALCFPNVFAFALKFVGPKIFLKLRDSKTTIETSPSQNI